MDAAPANQTLRDAQIELASPKLKRLINKTRATEAGRESIRVALTLQAQRLALAPALKLLRERRTITGWCELSELAQAVGGRLFPHELACSAPLGDHHGPSVLTEGQVLELRLRAAGVLVKVSRRGSEPARYRLPAEVQ